jgi:hypothetical protein
MKTKRNQPRNNRFKDISKMGYQAANKEVRSSYPKLQVTSFLGAIKPLFCGITLQGY